MAALCLLGDPETAVLQAAARNPGPSSLQNVSGDVTWFKNGEPASLPITQFQGQPYVSVEQLCKVSGAQLRWQPVTEQACLNNVHGATCFNWGRSEITRDGHRVHGKYKVRFENSKLLIPLAYVTSKEFQSFTQTKIAWSPREQQFVQTSPVTLRVPNVEKMSDRYRLTIDVPLNYPHYLIEQTPQKIWLRFVRATSDGSQILEGDTVIEEVHVVQKRHSADLIIETGPDAISNDVYLDDSRKRIVVDVFTSKSISVASKPPAPTSTIDTYAETKAQEINEAARKAALASRKGDKKGFTVVIDAGHGGMDSGAIGTRGTREKDINLDVAKALARQLTRQKNWHVVMTRTKDEFIPLNQRTDIANHADADLFISIHCNASLSPKGSGFETYVLSSDSTDKAAEAFARVENSVVTLEKNHEESSSKLNTLLASMAVSDFTNESSKFAGLVCRNVKNRSSVGKVAVKEADFFVLRGAQMPSILLELEYLSNPVSELRLRSSRYRNSLINGIVDGVVAYNRQVRKDTEAMASPLREARKTQ
jgi:N-acetylmuramoyl-L-alanine amidase